MVLALNQPHDAKSPPSAHETLGSATMMALSHREEGCAHEPRLALPGQPD